MSDYVEDGFETPEDGDLWPGVKSPRARAFLAALAETGSYAAASRASGWHASNRYAPRWRYDQAFQRALELARTISADGLEDEARRRAVDGVIQFKYDKHGSVLRHPLMCECGHSKDFHAKRTVEVDESELGPKGQIIEKIVTKEILACAHPDPCECVSFVGEPYYEHQFSDNLLKMLLEGNRPERYARRVELRGGLANINLELLPDHLIERIAGGEPIEAVLAGAMDEIQGLLAAGAPPAVEVGPNDEPPMPDG